MWQSFTVFLSMAALAALGCALPAHAADEESDARATLTPEHAAACVAALRKETDAMADTYRQGHVEIEAELMKRLQQGFAFVGTAYLHGVRDADANRMLKDAERAQESMPAPELAARQAACRAEGARLLERASAFERAVVSEAARRRLDRLKRPRSG